MQNNLKTDKQSFIKFHTVIIFYSNAINKFTAIWLVDVIKFATIKNCINPLG